MTHKTILITGGAGFIGSYVNKVLQSMGYTTFVIDNLSRGIKEILPKDNYFIGDICNPALIKALFESRSILAVFHFAAYIDVGESVADPSLYYLNNVYHTLSLLNSLRPYLPCPFIFSSSAAVYGLPQTAKITEDHPCNPINPYGESKWMVEKILKDFDQAYGMKYCSLRYFNAAGGDPQAYVRHPQTRSRNLIPTILRSLQQRSTPLTINGTNYDTPDGTCIRDYIHIDDLARAHVMALERLLAGGESSTYNLGNGHGYSIREVIDTVQKTLNQSVMTKEGPRRPGDPATLLADYSKAKKELGWNPRYGLSDMIAHAWSSIG